MSMCLGAEFSKVEIKQGNLMKLRKRKPQGKVQKKSLN